ncbi:MAG: transcriptional regulator [Desulfonatronovibrio sp.]
MICFTIISLFLMLSFAKDLGVPTNRITEILNERRRITSDTALRLSRYFGFIRLKRTLIHEG